MCLITLYNPWNSDSLDNITSILSPLALMCFILYLYPEQLKITSCNLRQVITTLLQTMSVPVIPLCSALYANDIFQYDHTDVVICIVLWFGQAWKITYLGSFDVKRNEYNLCRKLYFWSYKYKLYFMFDECKNKQKNKTVVCAKEHPIKSVLYIMQLIVYWCRSL